MQILIKNKFSINEKEEIIKSLLELIKKDLELTNRSKRWVSKRIDNNEIFIAFNQGDLAGFVVAHEIYPKYIEVKSLYVKKEYRSQGLAKALLKKAIKYNDKNYIGVTFQEEIMFFGNLFGFRVTKLNKLPLGFQISYIMTRNIESVFKHSFRRKSIIIVRKARK